MGGACALGGMGAKATEFQNVLQTVRVHNAVTAGAEKRLLVWMAERMPRWVNSDHLTSLGTVAMFGVGACFWLGGGALALVIPLLVLNWFGDSLDGTLARVRNQQRPRYGYYVDHVLDAVGFVALFGGLILGARMSPVIGLGFVAAYFLLVVEIALATHARGTFKMSAGGVGPTELRILLAIGTVQLMRSDFVSMFGNQWLLFDVGGAVGIAGLLLTFVVSAVSNGVALYKEERLPRPHGPTAKHEGDEPSARACMIRSVAILASVDDLFFRSKVRTTAKHLGIEIQFAATSDEMVAQAKSLQPTLVIFDLNSQKMDAIATIAALKADAGTAALRAIGFASHVHTELIAAARQAGADDVLPRSAFAGRLADILQAGAAKPAP